MSLSSFQKLQPLMENMPHLTRYTYHVKIKIDYPDHASEQDGGVFIASLKKMRLKLVWHNWKESISS